MTSINARSTAEPFDRVRIRQQMKESNVQRFAEVMGTPFLNPWRDQRLLESARAA